MRGLRVLVLIFAATRCAATVNPGAPDSGPAADVVMVELPSPDTGDELAADISGDRGTDAPGDVSSLTCGARLQSCDRDASTCSGSCGECQSSLVISDATGRGRTGGGVCAPVTHSVLCAGGLIARCSSYDQLCYGRPPTPTGSAEGRCHDIPICLELDRLARAAVRPGEKADRCQWGDGTFAHTGQTAAARCVDGPLRTCGTGCSPCPSDRTVCMFRSEVYPTGICMPAGSGIGEVGHVEGPGIAGYRCRISPEQVCPRGLACLIPVRNDVDIPDVQRWGRCYPPDVCQRFAASFADGYRCVTSLAAP